MALGRPERRRSANPRSLFRKHHSIPSSRGDQRPWYRDAAAITRPAIADGRLREVLPGIASHPFGVYFVYRAGTRLPKVAIAFQAFVTAKLLATGILTSTENAAHDR
jgi:hypothetical protein